MRTALFILSLCLNFTCSAQTWEVFQDDTAFFYRTMTAGLSIRYSLKPSAPNGRYKIFSAKGTPDDSLVIAELGWLDGELFGRCQYWDLDGNLNHEQSRDSMGNLDGYYFDTRYDGSKKQVGTYVNGCKDGEWRTFDKEGNLYIRTAYDLGCIDNKEYWKYEILLNGATRKRTKKMNELNGEKWYIRRGKPKLMSYEKSTYSSCEIRESSLFDPVGRLLKTVTFSEK